MWEQKANPQREGCGSKNIRIHVDGACEIPLISRWLFQVHKRFWVGFQTGRGEGSLLVVRIQKTVLE